jgi:hypothetical protein
MEDTLAALLKLDFYSQESFYIECAVAFCVSVFSVVMSKEKNHRITLT